MERSGPETDGYRRKVLKLKPLKWMEGFPLVPLEFWSNSNKGKKNGRESCLFPLGSSQTKESKRRVMNICKSPKIMAALWVWFSKSIGVVSVEAIFLLQSWLKKKSTSGDIEISKHPPRDVLVNSTTNAHKASWIFSGAAHQLRPLMGGQGSNLNLRTF